MRDYEWYERFIRKMTEKKVRKLDQEEGNGDMNEEEFQELVDLSMKALQEQGLIANGFQKYKKLSAEREQRAMETIEKASHSSSPGL